MIVGLMYLQSIIITKVVSLIPIHEEVYLIQLLSDLQHETLIQQYIILVLRTHTTGNGHLNI